MARVKVKDLEYLLQNVGMVITKGEGKGSHGMAIDEASNIKFTIPTHDSELDHMVSNSILTSINLVYYLHTKTYLSSLNIGEASSKSLSEALETIKNCCVENPMQFFTPQQRAYYNIRKPEQAIFQLNKLSEQVETFKKGQGCLQNQPQQNNSQNLESCRSM